MTSINRVRHTTKLLLRSHRQLNQNSLGDNTCSNLCNVVISRSYSRNGKNNNTNKDKKLSDLWQPVPVQPCEDVDSISIGAQLSGNIEKDGVIRVIKDFHKDQSIRELAASNGLDEQLFHKAVVGFRRFCSESAVLPADIHVILSDILSGHGHLSNLFPFFMSHAKRMFPHLDCIEDLQKISDLRQPVNWYSDARRMQRKIVFHAGPTNSGKTYHALERFTQAKSGIYCGPLRMLATEVFDKTNRLGTECDLVTGEDRRVVREDGEPAVHVACTVEMASVGVPYEVAVIDEIQMMRDPQRGWAWTRALLGICAEEVHLCGEKSTIELVKELALDMGDEVEVRQYDRLTPLSILSESVDRFDKIKPGDCIVCFNKNDIYHCSRQLERLSIECAVIYGGLPPGTKLAQAKKFNDPNNPCKVMVATDAIGMGLNLNIKRIIFYSMIKPKINEKGEKVMELIPAHQALQIAGRAGRFGTAYEHGECTTFKNEEHAMLRKLLDTPIDDVEHAGLHPTAEQIELFAYHLPKATLANLIDIFVTLSKVDGDRYFMCHVEDLRFLANMIEHVPLDLRSRYVFCCAPINTKMSFVCSNFLKFARQYSKGEPITIKWLMQQVNWPLQMPYVLADLIHLENVYDVFDLYLWLSYRFSDIFSEADGVRQMQSELDEMIQHGIVHLTQILHNTATKLSTNTSSLDEDTFAVQSRSRQADFVSSRTRARPKSESPMYYDEEREKLFTRPRKSLSSQFSEARERVLRQRELDKEKNTPSTSEMSNQQLLNLVIERGLVSKKMMDKLQEDQNDKED